MTASTKRICKVLGISFCALIVFIACGADNPYGWIFTAALIAAL